MPGNRRSEPTADVSNLFCPKKSRTFPRLATTFVTTWSPATFDSHVQTPTSPNRAAQGIDHSWARAPTRTPRRSGKKRGAYHLTGAVRRAQSTKQIGTRHPKGNGGPAVPRNPTCQEPKPTCSRKQSACGASPNGKSRFRKNASSQAGYQPESVFRGAHELKLIRR